jgi:hypothetical protein
VSYLAARRRAKRAALGRAVARVRRARALRAGRRGAVIAPRLAAVDDLEWLSTRWSARVGVRDDVGPACARSALGAAARYLWPSASR